MCDLWWKKWHWDRFFSEHFGLPLSVSFHQCSTLILSILCSYQKDKRSKPGNHSKSNALSQIGEDWIEKYFHLDFRSLISNTKSPKQKLLFWDTLCHKDSSCPFQVNVHFSHPVSRSYKCNYITAWISSQALWLDTFKDVTGYAFFRFTGRSKLHYLLPCNNVFATLLSLALSLQQNLYSVKNNYAASKNSCSFET